MEILVGDQVEIRLAGGKRAMHRVAKLRAQIVYITTEGRWQTAREGGAEPEIVLGVRRDDVIRVASISGGSHEERGR